VGDRERGAEVGCSAVRVYWRAVRYERGQGLGHWECAGRVDDRGRSAWNVRGCWLGRGASALARSDGYDASCKASLGLSSRGVSNRACGKCGVGRGSLSGRMVLRWCGIASRTRLATCRVHTTTWVRRLAARGMNATAWVRRLAVDLAVRRGGIDRWLIVRCGRVDWRLAVGVAVRCSWVYWRLAPD